MKYPIALTLAIVILIPTKGNAVNLIYASPIEKGMGVMTSDSRANTVLPERDADRRRWPSVNRAGGTSRRSVVPGGLWELASRNSEIKAAYDGGRETEIDPAKRALASSARTTQLASQEEPWNASGTGSPNHLMDAGSGPGRSRTGLQDTTAPSGWMVGSNLRTVSHGNCIEDRSLLGCSFSTAATIRPASIPSICSSELTRTTWRTCGVRGGVTLRVRINGNARIADVATRSLIPTSAARPTERGAVANVVSQVGAPVVAEQGNRARTTGPCHEWRYRHIIPSNWTAGRVRELIRCAVDKWPVSLSTALYVANRESHFYCWAVNPSGSSGTYQIISSTWDTWRAAFPWLSSVTVDSRLNCRSNVLTAIRAAYAYGWSAWSV